MVFFISDLESTSMNNDNLLNGQTNKPTTTTKNCLLIKYIYVYVYLCIESIQMWPATLNTYFQSLQKRNIYNVSPFNHHPYEQKLKLKNLRQKKREEKIEDGTNKEDENSNVKSAFQIKIKYRRKSDFIFRIGKKGRFEIKKSDFCFP